MLISDSLFKNNNFSQMRFYSNAGEIELQKRNSPINTALIRETDLTLKNLQAILKEYSKASKILNRKVEDIETLKKNLATTAQQAGISLDTYEIVHLIDDVFAQVRNSSKWVGHKLEKSQTLSSNEVETIGDSAPTTPTSSLRASFEGESTDLSASISNVVKNQLGDSNISSIDNKDTNEEPSKTPVLEKKDSEVLVDVPSNVNNTRKYHTLPNKQKIQVLAKLAKTKTWCAKKLKALNPLKQSSNKKDQKIASINQAVVSQSVESRDKNYAKINTLIDFLLEPGQEIILNTKGIFRISSSHEDMNNFVSKDATELPNELKNVRISSNPEDTNNSVSKDATEPSNKLKDDEKMNEEFIHIVACSLKKLFRDNERLIDINLRTSFVEAGQDKNLSDCIDLLSEKVVELLEPEKQKLLHKLVELIAKTANKSEFNRMPLDNLAIVWVNNLIAEPKDTSTMVVELERSKMAFMRLVENKDKIFKKIEIQTKVEIEIQENQEIQNS